MEQKMNTRASFFFSKTNDKSHFKNKTKIFLDWKKNLTMYTTICISAEYTTKPHDFHVKNGRGWTHRRMKCWLRTQLPTIWFSLYTHLNIWTTIWSPHIFSVFWWDNCKRDPYALHSKRLTPRQGPVSSPLLGRAVIWSLLAITHRFPIHMVYYSTWPFGVIFGPSYTDIVTNILIFTFLGSNYLHPCFWILK